MTFIATSILRLQCLDKFVVLIGFGHEKSALHRSASLDIKLLVFARPVKHTFFFRYLPKKQKFVISVLRKPTIHLTRKQFFSKKHKNG